MRKDIDLGCLMFFMILQMISGDRKQDTNTKCCNGTLGYADTPMMPCASLECCNQSFVVAVLPVNHAFGYGFRCINRSSKEVQENPCYKDQVVASTNDTSIMYGARTCCPGFKFDVRFNTDDTGIVIKCKILNK